MSTITKIAWAVMAALVLILALSSLRYFAFGSESYFPRQREVYEAQTAGILLHIGGMVFAALAGPFQFLRAFRSRFPRVHRAMGRVYIAGCMIGGLAGLYMAQYAASGFVSGLGFALLAVALLLTTGMAFMAIKRGDVQTHRNWMTRSFALILAAVTLRLYLPGLEAAFGEHAGYAVVAWACWLPNLVVAEWLIQSRPRAAVSASFAA
jgi:uncharacterized membrane protein